LVCTTDAIGPAAPVDLRQFTCFDHALIRHPPDSGPLLRFSVALRRAATEFGWRLTATAAKSSDWLSGGAETHRLAFISEHTSPIVARRTAPIEGAPGLGYILPRGYDLPPLMFSAISNSRGTRPSDGHSSASGQLTNAKGDVRAGAAEGPRDAAAALAAVGMASLCCRVPALQGDLWGTALQTIPTQQQGGAKRHTSDKR
jgi:hypothetical protein